MKSIIEKIKSIKYLKDYLLTAAVLLTMFLAVGGDGLADIAKTKFWASTWQVACVIAWVVCVVGWIYLYKKDKASQDK